MKYIYLTSTLILLSLIVGCGGVGNPTTPNEDDDYGAHFCVGVFTVNFDTENLVAEVSENHNIIKDSTITIWLPTPKITVNSFNPTTRIVDVDITVTNPLPANAYDLRVIIYGDNLGRNLENPDHWTRVFRMDTGWLVNPFKAFCKDDPNRKFAAKSESTENMILRLANDSDEMSFAIDVSYPGNCFEPYEITDFQHGEINPQYKSSTFLEVDVFDWQNDVSEVYIRVPEISDFPFDAFVKVAQNTWGAYLVNRRQAPAGKYYGIIVAFSANSKNVLLSDVVTITITPDKKPPKWVSTVGITDCVAGDRQVTIYWNMAVDDPNPPPVYYLLYKDTDDYPWDQTPVLRFWHNPHTFTDLQNGVKYYFNIKAIDTANPPNVDANEKIMTAIPRPHLY